MRLGDLDHLLLKLDAELSDDARYIDIADQIREIIDNAPTVETSNIEHKAYNEGFKDGVDQGIKLSERPQGKWIFMQGVTCGGYYKCNKCGEVERAEKNYCSNCGADMGGKEE